MYSNLSKHMMNGCNITGLRSRKNVNHAESDSFVDAALHKFARHSGFEIMGVLRCCKHDLDDIR